jgi:hypothetical protein
MSDGISTALLTSIVEQLSSTGEALGELSALIGAQRQTATERHTVNTARMETLASRLHSLEMNVKGVVTQLRKEQKERSETSSFWRGQGIAALKLLRQPLFWLLASALGYSASNVSFTKIPQADTITEVGE